MRVTYHPKASVAGNQTSVAATAPAQPRPVLLAPGAEVVKCAEDADAGEQRNRPTDHAPEEQYDVAQFVAGIVDHP